MFIGQAYEQFERFTGLPGNTHCLNARYYVSATVFIIARIALLIYLFMPTLLVVICSTERAFPESYGGLLRSVVGYYS